MLSCTQRRVIKIKNSTIIIRHDSTTQGHVCVRYSVFLFFSCAFFRCPYTGRPTTSSRRAATTTTTTTHSRGYTHFHKIKKANECCHTQTRRDTHTCSNPPTQTQSSVKKKSLTHTHKHSYTYTYAQEKRLIFFYYGFSASICLIKQLVY